MKQLLARFFREVKERQKQNAEVQPIDISHIAKSGILGAMTGGIAAALFCKTYNRHLTRNCREFPSAIYRHQISTTLMLNWDVWLI
jgi:hypothetical protein